MDNGWGQELADYIYEEVDEFKVGIMAYTYYAQTDTYFMSVHFPIPNCYLTNFTYKPTKHHPDERYLYPPVRPKRGRYKPDFEIAKENPIWLAMTRLAAIAADAYTQKSDTPLIRIGTTDNTGFNNG